MGQGGPPSHPRPPARLTAAFSETTSKPPGVEMGMQEEKEQECSSGLPIQTGGVFLGHVASSESTNTGTRKGLPWARPDQERMER